MEKDKKKSITIYVYELMMLLLTILDIVLASYLKGKSIEATLYMCVLSALGVGMVGFFFRQQLLANKLDYDNKDHVLRFWTSYLICLVMVSLCLLLPKDGWPILPVFVLLALFSNLTIGIASAGFLLFLPIALMDISSDIFLLYFISGVFCAVLFRKTENEFKVALPLFLSLLCLFLCLITENLLMVNARPNIEMVAIPVLNIIISGIVLILILKIFFALVIYRDRDRYLELNDTENSLLSQFKERNKQEFYICVHTAYFCERIAAKIGLSSEVLKCVAYYHKWDGNIDELMENEKFPSIVAAVLKEYQKKDLKKKRKETIVLQCAENVINTVLYIQNKNPHEKLNYEKIIDGVFKQLEEQGKFKYCDISLWEMTIIQNTFREERLYYDFLHR